MKHSIRSALTLAALVGVAIQAENTPPGYVDFGKFSPPTSGGEFVEVHITSNLISMAARLAEKNEPEIAELLRGLAGQSRPATTGARACDGASDR